MDSAADLAWGRYLETGAPEDLGEVFDRTCPVLVLLAARLLRRGEPSLHSAYDLVQVTFLEAIRCRERFERGRPVSPWLATILARRAADLRRGNARSAAVELGGEGFEEDVLRDAGRSPLEQAELRETEAVVFRALAGLSPAYRTVLNLHLLHGLSAGEISTSLERPLHTVYSQLRRGLSLLRERLPVEYAPGLAVGLWSGTAEAGLQASVRASLVDAAGTTASATATLPILGTSLLIMKKWIVGCAAVAVVVAGIGLWPRASERARDGLPVARSSVQAASAADASGERPAPSASEDAVARRPVEGSTARPEDRGPVQPYASGRCVNRGGVPIADVSVVLQARGARELARATSDAEGRFTLTLREGGLPPAAGSVLVFVAEAHLERQVPARSGDLGDIAMIHGGFLDVEVPPESLLPHPRWTAVALHLDTSRSSVRLSFAPGRSRSVTEAPILPGRWRFHAGLSHAVDIVPKEFVVRPGETTKLQVVPRLRAGISGTVLGGPWAGPRPRVRVHQRVAGGIYEAHDRVVDAEGRFTVREEGDLSEVSDPRLWIQCDGFESVEIPARWGETGLRIQLRPLPRILPVVLDVSGEPVESCWVSVADAPRTVLWKPLEGPCPEIAGIEGFPRRPGTWWLWVRTPDPVACLWGPLQVELREDDVRVELRSAEGREPLRVRVLGPDGAPAAGQRVAWTATDEVLPLPTDPGATSAGDLATGPSPGLLLEVETDGQGRAELPAALAEGTWLQVRGGGSAPTAVGPGQREVVLRTAATVDSEELALVPVVVELPSVCPEWVQVAWLLRQGGTDGSAAARGRRVGGRFRFEEIRPGSYRLSLFDPALPRGDGPPGPSVEVPPEGGKITLTDQPELPCVVKMPGFGVGTTLEILTAAGATVWKGGTGIVVLPGGRYLLRWTAGGSTLPDRAVVFRAGEQAALDVPGR